MSLRLKAYSFLALVLVLASGAYYYRSYEQSSTAKASSESEDATDDTIPVELAAATQAPISSYLTSTANLRALRDVLITSQAEGVVIEVLAEEGDYVSEGKVLCLLDDRQLQISLALAEQRAAQSRLQLEKATIRKEKAAVQILNTEVELRRKEAAFAEDLVSEEEVALLRYQVAELQHDERVAASEEIELGHRVGELEAEIDRVKLDISRTRISAPFAGHITERIVQLGQTIRNQDRLFRLGSFSPLYADVHLSESSAQLVRPGQRASIVLGTDAGGAVEGIVERLSPVVDGSTGTVKVTVRLTPSNGAFRPGAFVRVDIQTDTRADAILIPKRAIFEEDGETFVFVTDGEVAHRKKVEIGYQHGADIEIREGVSVGEKVVVAGQGNLQEGTKVRTIQG